MCVLQRLAQQASVPNIEAKLLQAGVPNSLWPKMRAVIGKHRGYSDALGLTDAKQRRLLHATNETRSATKIRDG